MRYFILPLLLLWLVPILVSKLQVLDHKLRIKTIRIGLFFQMNDDDKPIKFEIETAFLLLYNGRKHWTETN